MNKPATNHPPGVVSWFVRNPVAANLLAMIIIVTGALSAWRMVVEIFPETSVDVILVTVPYPGAAPAEVEEGICIRIEERIEDLQGIKKITSTAQEGAGSVAIEVASGYNVRNILDDVKTRVDAIDTFPDEAERPVIEEILIRNQVLNISVSGEVGEATLKKIGEQVRDEISAQPGITQVELYSAKPYEISIELSEEAMRRHGITFEQVASAVREQSIDLPGGTVRSTGGEMLLRTKGQAYIGPDFEDIAVLTRPDGTTVRIDEIAKVRDTFEEVDNFSRFNAKPAVVIQVFRVGDQNALDVSRVANEYVEAKRPSLPAGVDLTVWQDNSSYLKSRLELLIRNALGGLALVFLTLALFLKLDLAGWVSFGIPISFLGTFAVMPVLGITVNMISLFAFILVLGIVVDDAIVVGENIYTHFERHEDSTRASIDGAREVALPVVFAVLTTVVAFFPMLNVPGVSGKIWRVIPLVVIPTLLFSLVESKFILPSHLRHLKPARKRKGWNPLRLWENMQMRVSAGLKWFIQHMFQPLAGVATRHRYTTLAVFVALLTLSVGLVRNGWVKFVFFPAVEADFIIASVTLPDGTPASVTQNAIEQIESAARQVEEELDADLPPSSPGNFRHFLSTIGDQPVGGAARGPGPPAINQGSGGHVGEVVIELAPPEFRANSTRAIADRWRELTGSIPGAVELTFASDLVSTGEPINLQLTGPNFDDLRVVAEEIKLKLAEYPGVRDISDTFRAGKQELVLQVKPEAQSLGLTLAGLGSQVRQAFYGAEAQRFLRKREEVKVMVRYPAEERVSLANLENMRIRMPDGSELPFNEVAEAGLERGYSKITRIDRRRAINVIADVDTAEGNAGEILTELSENYLPDLLAQHPGVRYTQEGESREQADAMGGLIAGAILALFLIYALLAIPFKSYWQPFIVMAVIPFSFTGAMIGHIIMGMPISILSVCGMVALSGVVVNDSLVLVDYVNRRRAAGASIHDAAVEAPVARFRAVLLTSLTTFAGLTPLLLEKSAQAQFLIPMAVSLAFGVLYATVITLVLVPSVYLMMEDAGRGLKKLTSAKTA